MELNEIVQIISNNGMGFVLMAYFLWKDYRFNEQIINLLNETKGVLIELKTWHSAEDSK